MDTGKTKEKGGVTAIDARSETIKLKTKIEDREQMNLEGIMLVLRPLEKAL